MYLGWVIPLLILLPNLLMIFLPPKFVPPEPKDQNYKVMEIIERVGQVGCFGLPFFYRIPRLDFIGVGALAIMAGALVLYYAGWLRYVLRGRTYRLLFQPMLGVRLPLAVTPVIYFLSAATLLYSLPLGLAAILLATGHLYISRRNWQNAGQNAGANA